MSTGTVLLRELAIVARSPANYRMRTVVGFWATVYLGGALIQLGNRNDAGAQIFTVINVCAFFLLIVLGAIASADSISKERREGTLDLLFLTHLNARDIVHAKFTCGLFRVLTAALVLVPISTASMLVGGVNKGDILRTILMQCAAVLIGLASGVLASSFCRARATSHGVIDPVSGGRYKYRVDLPAPSGSMERSGVECRLHVNASRKCGAHLVRHLLGA